MTENLILGLSCMMARALFGKEERRATPVAAEADVLMNLRLLD
tara:strand:+ start:65584 stop:65712 length:129 start_codon:yes stop_codon:yes gene_type:complete